MRAPGNTVASNFHRGPGRPLHSTPTGGNPPIRVLGAYTGTHHHHPVRGTGKIEFRVAAKPDDELSEFHTDRKFAFVAQKLSMLLVLRKGRRMAFKIQIFDFTCQYT